MRVMIGWMVWVHVSEGGDRMCGWMVRVVLGWMVWVYVSEGGDRVDGVGAC